MSAKSKSHAKGKPQSLQFQLYLLHALTPLHLGTGQGHDLIDLPILRERATGHPVLPGSSVKGVLRAASAEQDGGRDDSLDTLTAQLFGPPPKYADKFAGALRFTDARLLLFPVQSELGTLAWVTSPLALARLRRDAGQLLDVPDAIPQPKDEGQALVDLEGALVDRKRMELHLAGLPLRAEPLPADWLNLLAGLAAAGDPAWGKLVRSRIAVLHDDTFTWLVENLTELRAHIRIKDETGTVDRGALWYEEAVPADTLFVGLLQAADNGKFKLGDKPILEQLAEQLREGEPAAQPDGTRPLWSRRLQFGANATTGMGLARFSVWGGAR